MAPPQLDARLTTDLWRIPDFVLDDIMSGHTRSARTGGCRKCGHRYSSAQQGCRSLTIAAATLQRRQSQWIGRDRAPRPRRVPADAIGAPRGVAPADAEIHPPMPRITAPTAADPSTGTATNRWAS
jgi:hypothetical protein